MSTLICDFVEVFLMDWKTMLRMAMAARRISANALSIKMMKSNNYINATLNRDASPTLDTLQAIADALNYDLQITLIDRQTGKRIDA